MAVETDQGLVPKLSHADEIQVYISLIWLPWHGVIRHHKDFPRPGRPPPRSDLVATPQHDGAVETADKVRIVGEDAQDLDLTESAISEWTKQAKSINAISAWAISANGTSTRKPLRVRQSSGYQSRQRTACCAKLDAYLLGDNELLFR